MYEKICCFKVATLHPSIIGPKSSNIFFHLFCKGRDVTFLDQYANERWETVLHYMVASSQQAGISADAVRTLLQAGLMSPDESQDHAPVITRSGFQFLLMERSSQVRIF